MKRIQNFLVLSMVILSVFAIMTPALAATADGLPSIEQVRDYYSDTYGPFYQWPQDVWVALQSDMERAGVNPGYTDKSYQAYLQHYGTPDAQAISMEEAVKAALSAIVQERSLDQTELEHDYEAGALYLIGSSHPVWKIRFVKATPYEMDTYHAEVNAYTGDVQNIRHFDDIDEMIYWCDPYVLLETIQFDPNQDSNG